MSSVDILRSRIEEWQDDPAYQYEGLVLAITEQIVGLMEKQGLRRTDLADRLGTSKAYVTQLFDGPSNLTLRTLVKIACALDANIDVRITQRAKANGERAPPRTGCRA
jgi:transcriptional regulator with XRE-family HTH domain